MPLPTALPYGIRDIRLTPFVDDSATAYDTPTVDLPYARTLSFSEAEEFTDLRGDDRLVATHGAGPQVEWEFEAGGISLPAYATIAGGEVVESGIAGTDLALTYTKLGADVRPYFKIEGQMISDSGGDFHCVIFKAKCNDALEGEFTDGEFFLSSGSGIGLPSTVTADEDKLYEFVQNEAQVAIPEPV